MQLYLVQHGEAQSEGEDPQRRLTDEGRETIEQLADLLSSLGLALDRIEHSDKLRARQTAEILATRLAPAGGTKQVSGMAPNDDVEPMRDRLVAELDNLMLVGHLPYLNRLLASLLQMKRYRAVVGFSMGGVVRLDRNESGEWIVQWVVTPELLRAFAERRRPAA